MGYKNLIMSEIREEPENCECCNEPIDEANWLPEGQCYCIECASYYWVEENEDF